MLDRKLCVWTNTVGMWTSLLQCVGGQCVCGQQCHSGCVDSSVTVGCVYNSVSVSVGTDPYSGSARRSPVVSSRCGTESGSAPTSAPIRRPRKEHGWPRALPALKCPSTRPPGALEQSVGAA